MNFIEAVEALERGDCEGIERPYFQNPANICFTNHRILNRLVDRIEDLLADDWQLVGAKPQTITKEVKLWASVDSTNGRVGNVGTKEDMEIAVAPQPNLIKIVELAGHYTVEVKPPVKRREEITIPCGEFEWVACVMDGVALPKGARFYCEWQEGI